MVITNGGSATVIAASSAAISTAIGILPEMMAWSIGTAIAAIANIIVAIAVMVHQKVGWLGVPVALVVVAVSSGLRYNTEYGSIDVAAAALVVTALTVPGRWRIALVIVVFVVFAAGVDDDEIRVEIGGPQVHRHELSPPSLE